MRSKGDVNKSYKFPRDKGNRKVKPAKMRRWNKKLANTTCPLCNGSGGVNKERCPRSYPNNHGYPVCKGGILNFTEYDIIHWDDLRKVYK